MLMNTSFGRRSFLLASAALSLSGLPRPAAAANDFNLAGRWVYRSFLNAPDASEDFGKLRLALATMEIQPFSGNEFTGTLRTGS
jgi:hypothetical protein